MRSIRMFKVTNALHTTSFEEQPLNDRTLGRFRARCNSYITFAGFFLAVFGTGVAVGRIVEKIERLERKKDDEEHKNTSKNDRR